MAIRDSRIARGTSRLAAHSRKGRDRPAALSFRGRPKMPHRLGETVEKLEQVTRRGRGCGWPGASEAHPQGGPERASDAARRPFCLAPHGLRCLWPWPALLAWPRWRGYRLCARALASAKNHSNANHSSISTVSCTILCVVTVVTNAKLGQAAGASQWPAQNIGPSRTARNLLRLLRLRARSISFRSAKARPVSLARRMAGPANERSFLRSTLHFAVSRPACFSDPR